MVVLDTNILIDYIRRPKSSDSHLVKLIQSRPTENLAISVITVQELYVGQSSKIPQKEKYFIDVIKSLKILPFEYETAKLAGEILRDINPDIEFADAAIAATTILNKAKLLTLNKKDFQAVKSLKLI